MIRRLRRCFVTSLLGALALLPFTQSSLAGSPEYMRMKPKVGIALELKGYMNDQDNFVATDAELLPKPRSPKLRGEIDSIDSLNKTITMFGMKIRFYEKTTFIDEGGEKATFKSLKVGQRIEVSCKVRSSGKWKARKIRAHGVKSSNKIKGTITGISVDGVAPDTLNMSGLLIILNKKTDYDEPENQSSMIEKVLFGDLEASSSLALGKGVPVSDYLILEGQYRQDLKSQNEYDLAQNNSTDIDGSEQTIRLEMSGFWSKQIRTFTQLRFRKRYLVSTGQNLPPSKRPSEEGLLRFTQLYVLLKDFWVDGLALKLGRQDFDEPREWLFDEYLDALTIYYYGLNGFILDVARIDAVSSLKTKFETWTDNFLRVRYFLDPKNEISAYWLSRKDTSPRSREPIWYGVRYYGEIDELVRPWFDYSILKGEDKGHSQSAWAFDIGATVQKQTVKYKPSITLGYAVGSGDDPADDPTSQEFRQTAYQDNADRFGGMSSVRYYGAVLDPELSNLKVLTLGMSFQPIRDGSIEVVYHKYSQHQLDTDLKGSNLFATPFGQVDDLGTGFDIVVTPPEFWDHLRIVWTLGVFNPGDAYAPRLDRALLSKFNVNVWL